MAKNKFIITTTLELNEPASKNEVTRHVVEALQPYKEGDTRPKPLVNVKKVRVRSIDFD